MCSSDPTIYSCELEKSKKVSLPETSGRRLFLYLTNGRLTVNNHEVFSKEQAHIDIDEPLSIKAVENSEFILKDVPSCKGDRKSEV